MYIVLRYSLFKTHCSTLYSFILLSFFKKIYIFYDKKVNFWAYYTDKTITKNYVTNNNSKLFRYANWWEWLVSWGSHQNLTFQESLTTVLDVEIELNDTLIFQKTNIPKDPNFLEYDVIFLPNIGKCKHVKKYDPLRLIQIELKFSARQKDVDVFITDSRDVIHKDEIRLNLKNYNWEGISFVSS